MPRIPVERTDFPHSRAALNLGRMDVRIPIDPDDASDDVLMQAWAGGDARAFEALYGRHRDRLYRFLLRRLGERSLADEVFQDTWHRVVAAGRGWRPEAAFATWLYRIARNRVADHWRARRHRGPAPADAEDRALTIEDPDTPERRLDALERGRALRRALDALPDEQREVMLLRLEQELSLQEIGEITGVGRETVKSRLRYAMDKLRAALAGPEPLEVAREEEAP